MRGYKDQKNNDSNEIKNIKNEIKKLNCECTENIEYNNIYQKEENILMKRDSRKYDEKNYINKIRKKHFKYKDIGYTKIKFMFENNLNLLNFIVGFLKSKKFNEDKIAEEINKIENIEKFKIIEYIEKFKKNI